MRFTAAVLWRLRVTVNGVLGYCTVTVLAVYSNPGEDEWGVEGEMWG